MVVKSAAKKVYLQPGKLVYDVMHNMMALQKGSEIYSDELRGILHYSITIDGLLWTLRFSVSDMDWSRCGISLEIEEKIEPRETDGKETGFLEDMIHRQFALLDSMLLNLRPFRVTYGEKGGAYSGGRKNYLQPVDMILNGIHDLAGLQKAETLMTDSARGLVRLRVTVYAEEREYQFSVEDIGGRRSRVTIELAGEGPDTQRLIDHEFALLDYVLVDRTKIELAEIEEWDRKILASKDSFTNDEKD